MRYPDILDEYGWDESSQNEDEQMEMHGMYSHHRQNEYSWDEQMDRTHVIKVGMRAASMRMNEDENGWDELHQ